MPYAQPHSPSLASNLLVDPSVLNDPGTNTIIESETDPSVRDKLIKSWKIIHSLNGRTHAQKKIHFTQPPAVIQRILYMFVKYLDIWRRESNVTINDFRVEKRSMPILYHSIFHITNTEDMVEGKTFKHILRYYLTFICHYDESLLNEVFRLKKGERKGLSGKKWYFGIRLTEKGEEMYRKHANMTAESFSKRAQTLMKRPHRPAGTGTAGIPQQRENPPPASDEVVNMYNNTIASTLQGEAVPLALPPPTTTERPRKRPRSERHTTPIIQQTIMSQPWSSSSIGAWAVLEHEKAYQLDLLFPLMSAADISTHLSFSVVHMIDGSVRTRCMIVQGKYIPQNTSISNATNETMNGIDQPRLLQQSHHGVYQSQDVDLTIPLRSDAGEIQPSSVTLRDGVLSILINKVIPVPLLTPVLQIKSNATPTRHVTLNEMQSQPLHIDRSGSLMEHVDEQHPQHHEHPHPDSVTVNVSHPHEHHVHDGHTVHVDETVQHEQQVVQVLQQRELSIPHEPHHVHVEDVKVDDVVHSMVDTIPLHAHTHPHENQTHHHQ